MKIDGKKLASEILDEIKNTAETNLPGVSPKLAIITVGEEDSWQTYVTQKIKTAQNIGFQTLLINLENANNQSIRDAVAKLNHDASVHGIIIQRPLPPQLNADKLIEHIKPEKDVDGFRMDSPFTPPIWLAVRHILEYVMHKNPNGESLNHWLHNKTITVVGKGETAGKPVIKGLYELGCIPKIIDSKTPNPGEILKKSDVVISGTGKPLIHSDDLKKNIILIGIGIRKEDGRLKGDYDEYDIENIASHYTPTPGGVGPLNLTYLFKNLVDAARLQSQSKV